jgi:polyisoprenoid-binding protein YceI
MFNGLRIAAVIVALIAVISIGSFFYLTRDIAAPSQAVQTSVEQLETSDESGSEVVYRISQDDSQAEYIINEVLNGADKTVVGTTNEVAGDILLNLSDLSQSEIGEISINARTFATDDDRRDNSVARFILQSESDDNEFITFQPTNISALPDNAAVGDTLDFQATGDLTIAGMTQSVTFDVTATLETEDQVVGTAETTVNYADFNLSIPDVPFVASVEDQVVLTLDFVANAVDTSTAA